MAFVARNDRHGNEIMRVMLSAEPGKPTVASCHNLRINCGPAGQLDTAASDGRFDHRQRFHHYAQPEAVGQPEGQVAGMQQPSNSDDESAAAWHTAEINAHSTLLNRSKAAEAAALEKPSSEKQRDFHCWLAAKNEAQLQLAQDRRLLEQQQDERAAERARLASLHFENWCASKSTRLRRAKSDASALSTPTPTATATQASETQQQQRLNDWESAKLAALKAQRVQRKAKDAQQQLIESRRRERSAAAWEQWMETSRSKARPVPMGKGLESLRASMAPVYTNPNEWQTLLPTQSNSKKQQQQQQQQQHVQQSQQQQRHGPDYERLERLAQPRRQSNWKPGNVSLKTQPELRRQSSAPDADVDADVDADADAASWLSLFSDPNDVVAKQLQLQPREKPLIWSTHNAQRVLELRQVFNPLDELPVPTQLRHDQLEQLRRQQDLQNAKILPPRYQQKREQLRAKLKPWVEEGKLQPERLSLVNPVKHMTASKPQPQPTAQPTENADEDGEDDDDEEEKQEMGEQLKEKKQVQRSEHHMEPSSTRQSLSHVQRAGSTDPVRLLKLREAKAAHNNSRPWR